MSEEKKPKIDLKSRLQKVGGGASAPVGGVPAPPGMGGSPGGVPVPTGLPGLPGDSPYREAAPPPPAEPQRIELDESAITEARDGAKKGMRPIIVLGTLVGIALGFVSGTGYESKGAVSKSKSDAAKLKEKVDVAKDQAVKLADKLDAGRLALLAPAATRKFPDGLSNDLRDLKIGFGGDELAMRRFSAFKGETTQELVDFVTRVQAVNEKREFVQRLLSRLEKPIKAELASGPAASTFKQVIVIDKDSVQKGVFISLLTTPAKVDNVPAELTFTGPSGQPAKLARLTELKVPEKGASIPVNPISYNAICPSEAQGEIAQLVRQLNSLRNEVRPDKAAANSDVFEVETEAGIVARAEHLSVALAKVQ